MPCVKEGGADLCSFSFFVWSFCNYRKRIAQTATTIHTFWSVNWALFLLILTEITCSLNSLTLFWSWEKTPAASCPFGTGSFRVSQIAVSSWFTGLWPCLSETCLLLTIWAAWSSELKNTEKQTQKSNLPTYLQFTAHRVDYTEWYIQTNLRWSFVFCPVPLRIPETSQGQCSSLSRPLISSWRLSISSWRRRANKTDVSAKIRHCFLDQIKVRMDAAHLGLRWCSPPGHTGALTWLTATCRDPHIQATAGLLPRLWAAPSPQAEGRHSYGPAHTTKSQTHPGVRRGSWLLYFDWKHAAGCGS